MKQHHYTPLPEFRCGSNALKGEVSSAYPSSSQMRFSYDWEFGQCSKLISFLTQ